MESYFNGYPYTNALSQANKDTQESNDAVYTFNGNIDFLVFQTVGLGGAELKDGALERRANLIRSITSSRGFYSSEQGHMFSQWFGSS